MRLYRLMVCSSPTTTAVITLSSSYLQWSTTTLRMVSGLRTTPRSCLPRVSRCVLCAISSTLRQTLWATCHLQPARMSIRRLRVLTRRLSSPNSRLSTQVCRLSSLRSLVATSSSHSYMRYTPMCVWWAHRHPLSVSLAATPTTGCGHAILVTSLSSAYMQARITALRHTPRTTCHIRLRSGSTSRWMASRRVTSV